MDNDLHGVKATLAAAVLQVMANASELKRKDTRGPAVKHVAEVTEDLFKALFPTK